MTDKTKNTHGGARPNAGRKKGSTAEETMTPVFVHLPSALLEKIDRHAAERGVNRSRYIRERLAEVE